jgi:hypothetical protein
MMDKLALLMDRKKQRDRLRNCWIAIIDDAQIPKGLDVEVVGLLTKDTAKSTFMYCQAPKELTGMQELSFVLATSSAYFVLHTGEIRGDDLENLTIIQK